MTTRTLRLPPDEAVPRTSQTYRVLAIHWDGDFDVGVSLPPDDDGTLDEFPPTVHDLLVDLANENLDTDRLEAETTAENWLDIGTVTLSRVDGETVEVAVRWTPR